LTIQILCLTGDPGDLDPSAEGEHGFVSVTEERSKRKKMRKSAPETQTSTSTGTSRAEKFDIQFNRLTTPDTIKHKTSKKPKKSTEKESQRSKTGKKSKDSRRDEVTTKSSKKDQRKNEERTSRRANAEKERRSSSPNLPPHPSAFPSHWNEEMREFYGTVDTKKFNLTSIMSKQPGTIENRIKFKDKI
jgi:hypothetical protein